MKHRTMAVLGYTPGPDLDGSPNPGDQVVRPAMVPTYVQDRVVSGMDLAAPVQQFTPEQAAWRRSLANGRWPADYNTGAAHYLYQCRQDAATGAVDVIRLDCHTRAGDEQYLDLDGQGGRDYAARRP
jgi:hypothetical protein